MKYFVTTFLARCAARVIRREKPEIVAVTGSVGKTSTKDAIAAVLGGKFDIRVTHGNLNTEIGLPLTVLGLPSGGRSPLSWLAILPRAWMRSYVHDRAFPGTLVLEMASDRPGDIAQLCDIASPMIGVVTAVGESHHEFFGSIDAVEKEKRTLIERLPAGGVAVLNRDDERVWRMRGATKASVMGFGFHEEAVVRALEATMVARMDDAGKCGVQLKVRCPGSEVEVFLGGTLGRHAVHAALAAFAVGISKGMTAGEITERLPQFTPPAGRMRCLGGIKKTLLIDDTYNAAPKSTLSALDALHYLQLGEGCKKIAVLGDMLELGSISVRSHEEVGRAAVDAGADVLVFVGERMGDAEKAARAHGAAEGSTFHFGSAEEAGRFVQERMRQGDVVLVKGSQGMRMEKVVKELMAEPLKAEQLLVRQSAEWLAKT